MSREGRTEEEWIEYLLANAISNNGCLECHLAPVERGYCYIAVDGRYGVKWRAHRFIWYKLKGPIPGELMVLHSCDNRRCINIDHLFLGTAADNTKDMFDKGRHVYGGSSWRKELTAERIAPLFQKGLSDNAIANRLRISTSTVWNYTKGHYREHLDAVLAKHECTNILG